MSTILGYPGVDSGVRAESLTPRSNQHVNSPHNLNNMFVKTGIEKEDNYQLKRCGFDLTPNSYDYPTKKSMVLVRRINVSILGVKIGKNVPVTLR